MSSFLFWVKMKGSVCGGSCVMQIGLSTQSHVESHVPSSLWPSGLQFLRHLSEKKKLQNSLKQSQICHFFFPTCCSSKSSNSLKLPKNLDSASVFADGKQSHVKPVSSILPLAVIFAKIQILCGMQASSGSSNRREPFDKFN